MLTAKRAKAPPPWHGCCSSAASSLLPSEAVAGPHRQHRAASSAAIYSMTALRASTDTLPSFSVEIAVFVFPNSCKGKAAAADIRAAAAAARNPTVGPATNEAGNLSLSMQSLASSAQLVTAPAVPSTGPGSVTMTAASRRGPQSEDGAKGGSLSVYLLSNPGSGGTCDGVVERAEGALGRVCDAAIHAQHACVHE